MNTLLIFLKYPAPGTVKTRLASSIGAEAACDVYQKLVDITLQQVRGLQGIRMVIAFDPPEKTDEVKSWLGEGFEYLPQQGNDLGERLQNATQDVLQKGSDRVVVIGTDAPDISSEIIYDAFNTLESHDAVIGPAQDGGYYLIGVSPSSNSSPQGRRNKEIINGLFEGIDWSTDKVLNQTVQKIKEKVLSYKFLETLRDVDTEEDFEQGVALSFRGTK